MPGWLTTHVLDTARGRPATALEIELFRIEEDERCLINRSVTNDDGRTDGPILPEADFQTGTYELIFHAGPYLATSGALDRKQGTPVAPGFLDAIPIRFIMAEDAHYHVPLLLSPFGYSTYRGS